MSELQDLVYYARLCSIVSYACLLTAALATLQMAYKGSSMKQGWQWITAILFVFSLGVYFTLPSQTDLLLKAFVQGAAVAAR